jgi:cbb3-type cytochrome oxidase maturation protein
MSILALLIPVALGLALLALCAFLWAVRSGQYDDLEGAANRILFDEDDATPDRAGLPSPPTSPNQ